MKRIMVLAFAGFVAACGSTSDPASNPGTCIDPASDTILCVDLSNDTLGPQTQIALSPASDSKQSVSTLLLPFATKQVTPNENIHLTSGSYRNLTILHYYALKNTQGHVTLIPDYNDAITDYSDTNPRNNFNFIRIGLERRFALHSFSATPLDPPAVVLDTVGITLHNRLCWIGNSGLRED